jgi:hypothetical protein
MMMQATLGINPCGAGATDATTADDILPFFTFSPTAAGRRRPVQQFSPHTPIHFSCAHHSLALSSLPSRPCLARDARFRVHLIRRSPVSSQFLAFHDHSNAYAGGD